VNGYDNFSASGLYVWLERRVEPGTKLFAIVRLSTSSPETPAPRVAVRGIALGAEPQPDGTWGVAVRFTRYRFLSTYLLIAAKPAMPLDADKGIRSGGNPLP
jgi:hypothetical protein